MSPIDKSPHAGEMMNSPPEQEFPRPQAGQESDRPPRGESGANKGQDEPDIGHRPSLPDHPELMAADVEDEEADPVIDSGPGIADGVHIPSKQRG